MREHLLVSEGPGGAWRLTGLIDFEPAMRGEREYEFVGVGVFVAAGDFAQFFLGGRVDGIEILAGMGRDEFAVN